MICKACGKTIPSALLQRDSFSCPTCGKMYRRSTGSTQSKPAERRQRSSAPRKIQLKPMLSGSAPKWLVILLAALMVVLLVVNFVLLGNRGSGNAFRVAGTYAAGEIAMGNSEDVVIEIPEQPDTDYMVLTESNEKGVLCSISKKTNTSFLMKIQNIYTGKRNPTITWGLIPYTPVEQQSAS